MEKDGGEEAISKGNECGAKSRYERTECEGPSIRKPTGNLRG